MPTYVLGSGVGDNYATLLLTMVDVDWFKRAVMGALYTMSEPNNWREDGDVDVSFAVEEVAKMLEDYQFLNFNPIPVGHLIIWPLLTPPDGYLICDGSFQLIADYPELYAVIGDYYGSDTDGFYLPYMPESVVVQASDSWPVGQTGGSKTVTLDTSQIPSHTHTIPMTATTLAVEPGEVTVLTPIPFFTQDTGSTGGDGAHENMPPFITMNYCIYAGRI